MSYSSEVLTDSPYGYWRLGDSSGTTMTDSSGNGRNGSYVNSPTLAATSLLVNDSDTSVSFASASSHYALFNDDNGLDGLSAFSVVCLTKPTSTTGITMLAARDDTTGQGRSFQFRVNAGKLEFVKIANGTVVATSSATLSAGTAYHVAATYDGTTVRLYINGSADGTVTTSGSLGSSTTALRIGARRHNSTGATVDFYNGVIDEVSVYTSTLSSTRISDLSLAAHAGALGRATETDTAQAITATGNQSGTISQASETDSAQAITPASGSQSIALSQASESDIAQALAPIAGVVTATLGQAVESDTAQAFEAQQGQSATINQASETDSAGALTPVSGAVSMPLEQATETDSAGVLTPVQHQSATLGQASETDTAQAIGVYAPQSATLGQASETNTAGTITVLTSIPTDTSDGANGRTRIGRGSLIVSPVLDSTPATTEPVRLFAQTVPDPVMSGGQPV